MFSSLFPVFASFGRIVVIVYSVDLLDSLVYNTILRVLEQTCCKFGMILYDAFAYRIEPKSNICINLFCGNHLIRLVFYLILHSIICFFLFLMQCNLHNRINLSSIINTMAWHGICPAGTIKKGVDPFKQLSRAHVH